MPGKAKIKTRCPVCQARYHVPAGSIGHKARCIKCQATFRVAEAQPVPQPRVPTEDDILDWLNEGMDEEFVAARPRVVSAGDPEPAVPEPPDVLKEDDAARPDPDAVHRPVFHPRLTEPPSPAPQQEAYLRKTG